MLIEADASGLEVVAVAYLSQDPTLCEELRQGIDIHGNNQARLKLPTRVIAKIFVFRLIYGGNEYSYSYDPDFNWISTNPKFWKSIIDAFYTKYTGIAKWHAQIIEQAKLTSGYRSPMGRMYHYEPKQDSWGNWKWPITQILNYPVQGFGADLMTIARISARNRLGGQVDNLNRPLLFINTVHDSIGLDSPPELVYTSCITLEKVFEDIPRNFEKLFKTPFGLPMKGEIKYGLNWKDMRKFNKEEGIIIAN